MNFVPVRGADIRPGMVIYRSPVFSKRTNPPETVGKFSGKCQKGLHFGQACYDVISTWWVLEGGQGG